MTQDDAANQSQIKFDSYRRAMEPVNSGQPPQMPALEDMRTWDSAMVSAYYQAGGREP